MSTQLADAPNFSEFKSTFNPEIHIDEHYQQLYADHGFEIATDAQDLVMMAYAVNPNGFIDKKDRPLRIEIGGLNKRPTVHGRYRRKKNLIDVYRLAGFSDEQRIEDLECHSDIINFYKNSKYISDETKDASLERLALPIIPQIEAIDMNSTLIHELQHAADNVNNTNHGELHYRAKIGAAILATGYGVTYISRTALSEGLNLMPENITTNPTVETIAALGIISLPVLLSLKSQFMIINSHNIYLNKPSEIRARQAEKVTSLLPQPIRFKSIN